MSRRASTSAAAATALVLAALAAGEAAGGSDPWRRKVDPAVLAAASGGGRVEFLVVLAEQADLGGAGQKRSKLDKGRFVVDRLRATAERSQPPVVAGLEALAAQAPGAVEIRPYWIVNLIWVRGDLGTLRALAERPDVARVAANPRVTLDGPVSAGLDRASSSAAGTIEPNIEHVGAPDLWAAGYTGQGSVVAGADSGVDWNHPALKGSYRGWDGAVGHHDHNWHDAIHNGGAGCGADSPVPCDDNGHGTRTMGAAVGDGGAGNRIGVAPGARWIACRNMDLGVGTPATYIECFQFFLAPTNLAGQNPEPSLAPDVVNNSWRCPPGEGCTDPAVLQAVVGATRAAGITVVVAAGNGGEDCGGINTPPGIYDASTTVGATDDFDEIASFSLRGPVTVDSSDRFKPDLVAPGIGIRSSVPGGLYGPANGTSMSAPHVTGLAALLISAAPCLRGDVDAQEAYMSATAQPLPSTERCGDTGPEDVPNPTYGWGAIRAVLPTGAVCSLIFSDEFETGDTSPWSSTLP